MTAYRSPRSSHAAALFAIVVLALASLAACSPKLLTLADVVSKLNGGGATVVTENPIFAAVGGKGCVGATSMRIDGYSVGVFEYESVDAAKNAKFQLRNSVQSKNFLFAPPVNVTTPIPPNIIALLKKSLTLEE